MTAPAIALPKGGGAIRGMGEKFAANPVTGTASLTVPLPTSPGRSGFGPQLALTYDSGAGNGPFGFGWSLTLPQISRKTDKGLPQYNDAEGSDTFLLSGAEDLVPLLVQDAQGQWVPEEVPARIVAGETYRIRRYRPRIEGLFARIERWTRADGDVHWRSISRDNILTLYGRDDGSRIRDPADPRRIFSWLICETRDDKGNAVLYQYRPEDSLGIDHSQAHEQHRTAQGRAANRYIKQIRYGNRTPLLDEAGERPPLLSPAQLSVDDWMFAVIFDYGEHNAAAPLPDDAGVWPGRPDPFSAYRAGFEVRTYRLCRRVLMFHHFPDEPEVGRDCLVRSTTFAFRESPIACFITAVTQSGHRRAPDGGYVTRSLPPLAFEYSTAVIGQEIRDVDAADLANLPYGADGTAYQWIDLDGEGLTGVLTQQGGAWFYKRNRSPLAAESTGTEGSAQFAPVELVTRLPGCTLPTAERVQFLDLAGDGQVDVVTLDRPAAGFYERTADGEWEPFRAFRSLPNLAWNDPNLKFIDLSGDGHADLLITEEQALTWYSSLGEAGFGAATRLTGPTDETRGPRILFADGSETIFLADLSGDGLTDIARIRNGEVCYWPNLGYGRFGAKISMDAAPWFDPPDQFDPRRLRLADIDGSGITDIIYLGRNRTRFWFNLSGNAWGAPNDLPGFPSVDNMASVAAVDLLGNGTACLVWSSALPAENRSPMKYIALMAQGKPHLLVRTCNHLGAETHVRYAPSTYFYLRDQAAGRPWITKLPFPVHVVERVETYDRIGRNRFVTRYDYHHGYFDGPEREFRGFGMVEQRDTESFAALSAGGDFPVGANEEDASHVPPVLTKTWFHTGLYLGHAHVSDYFAGLGAADDAGEYYREPGLNDDQARALLLEDTVLPAGLTAEEEHEACRALKGAMLRQEVYALDGSDRQPHPYTVSEQNFTIRTLQPRAGNHHAVFFTHARETLGYHYERDPADPRRSQALTLAVDDFGNVLQSAAVGYGRRTPDASLAAADQAEQAHIHITWEENRVTHPIAAADDHRTPLPAEVRSYELTGLVLPAGRERFTLSELRSAAAGAAPIAYEASPAPGILQKRLIEHMRTHYRPDDLGASQNDPLALLPLGSVQARALPGESYQLAFTPGLLDQIYIRDGQHLLPADPADLLGGGPERGGYVDLDGDGHWWTPSGRVFFSPESADDATSELTFARNHFFLPHRYRDPFHAALHATESIVTYDAYNLLLHESIDALGNRLTAGERDAQGNLTIAGNDYRVLQPRRLMDANRNRMAVAFDALGLVAGSAVMGKPPPAAVEGDSLEGFAPDLDEAALSDHLAHPLADPGALLTQATTRLVYDLFAYQRTQDQPNPQPAVVYTLVRETHAADLAPGEQTKMQHSFSYSDGFGREIQKKIQAEPGPVPRRDADGRIIVGADGRPEMTTEDFSPRWVGSGWTVLNNKGNPVRKYEPFFSDTHGFEFDVRIGVSPVLYYDPVGRAVATLHPDHTWEKVRFDAWRQETWDVNDTVLLDPRLDADVHDFFLRLPDAAYLPTWHTRRQGGALGPQEQAAAAKTAMHAATPTVAHTDSLGRVFLTIAHNKFKYSHAPPTEAFHATRTVFDIEGNPREAIDAKARIVMRYDYDLLGNRIHHVSMEAGERWVLNDATGNPLCLWDSRGHRFRIAYDRLRRPTDSLLGENSAAELKVGRTIYGETQPDPEVDNLRGQTVQIFDQAGIVTNNRFDFKGNLLADQRRLAQNYKTILDWSGGVPLEADGYASRTRYDALNRPMEMTPPHPPAMPPSIIRPGYNEANLLERIEAHLRGAADATRFIDDIDYNARGQRTRIDYGNGVHTTYAYDPLTLRRMQVRTLRGASRLQDLVYTYDPAGNISAIQDDAQQTIYFNGQVVTPHGDYLYDALYRLIEATGREHIGQSERPEPTWDDASRARLPHPHDGQTMRNYLEQYAYDALGNFERLTHRAVNGHWTRTYAYAEPSRIEPTRANNRLSGTVVIADGGPPLTESYAHDAHGNMTAMPHLSLMVWDFQDRLQATARQVVEHGDGETTYYVYDGGGRRVRKVTERANGQVKDERIYLGGFELYRRHGAAPLARETLHITDGGHSIALVETRTDTAAPEELIRYQFGNHLGSAALELDAEGRIVSYEEYYPYGATSYQAGPSAAEVGLKRYRYSGMERDEESGFAYHQARYYLPWLGRWLSADPSGLRSGLNLYGFCHGNPISFSDVNGRDPLSVGEAGDLPKTATHADLVQYARRKGYDYTGPEGHARFRMSPEGGQWTVDARYLKQRVYSPIEGSEGGFGNSSSDKRYGNAPSIKSGPYSTDPSSGAEYDPFAPKAPPGTGKKKDGGTGGSPKGKRTTGPPGGSDQGSVTGTPGGVPADEGEGGGDQPKEGEKLDFLTELASMVNDITSLHEAKKVKSGDGSPSGSSFGFIGGGLAKALTWVAAFGSWAAKPFTWLAGKIARPFKKAWRKLFPKPKPKPELPRPSVIENPTLADIKALVPEGMDLQQWGGMIWGGGANGARPLIGARTADELRRIPGLTVEGATTLRNYFMNLGTGQGGIAPNARVDLLNDIIKKLGG
jgi:RHS repeat-associated protein